MNWTYDPDWTHDREWTDGQGWIDDEDGTYAVECILDAEKDLDGRGGAGRWMYLVKWKGYDEETWEPRSSFPPGFDTRLLSEARKAAMIGGDDDDDDAGGADVGREVKRQRVEVEEPVPPSELNKDDRVRVQWASTEQFDGTVTDKMTKLVTAKESVSGARVAYDNGSDVWHFDGDAVTVWRLSAAAAPAAFE